VCRADHYAEEASVLQSSAKVDRMHYYSAVRSMPVRHDVCQTRHIISSLNGFSFSKTHKLAIFGLIKLLQRN